MDALFHWITAHPGESFLIYLVYMAAVQAMRRPTEKSSEFYTWIYQFTHLLAMNIQLVLQPRKANTAELEENKKAAEQASRQ